MSNREAFSREGYLKERYHYFHLRDTAGQERDFHFHDFDKLIILISGSVEYAVEGSIYSPGSWDVLLVKHHTIHKAMIDKSAPYERIIIYLDRGYFDRAMPDADLFGCFDRAAEMGQYVFKTGSAERNVLRRLLEDYERCAVSDEYGMEAMKDTYIMQLLINVGRIAAGNAAAVGEKQYDLKLSGVLTYINEHLTEELTVELLAEKAYLSRYHFMRLFKAQTGSTVHAYVRQKRLMYASRLIREGTPAVRAAAESGFGDYSAFHRAFTETFGISPGKMKENG